MKNLDSHVRERIWQLGPITIIILIRLLRDLGSAGGVGGMWFSEAVLAIGWVMGHMLAELDHVFYTSVCNPQELTCQRIRKEIEAKNWRNAWGLLQATKGERSKLPIRNMLTAAVVLGLGIWLISSNTNYLAMGAILGLTYRLFAEALAEKDYKKWYWLFAREFSHNEHRGLMGAWALVLVWETVKVILI